MLHAIAEADLRDVLPTIAVPTLLLYGEEDQRSPLSVAKRMHEVIPGSSLVTLPDVGHMSNIEAPRAVQRRRQGVPRCTRYVMWVTPGDSTTAMGTS